jgi:anthranilate synthase component 1
MHKMKKIKLNTTHHKLLADTTTPVSVYLKLRDRFAGSLLLESSDYHDNQNRFSYICLLPYASFKVKNDHIQQEFFDDYQNREIGGKEEVLTALQDFVNRFEVKKDNFEFITNGAFGYLAYDSIQYFEDITLTKKEDSIPEIFYQVFQVIIAIDQFKNELYLFEHLPADRQVPSKIQEVIGILKNRGFGSYPFKLTGQETSNLSDAEYIKLVEKGIDHCHRGDVFQMVLSRRFNQTFFGDEFNVYRALRSINPSPYLFYFDLGDFKLFGSSPEAQIEIQNGKASIYPIAGTFKRTGNKEDDSNLANQLEADPKENAEHVMLVDLARNDLSKHGHKVAVEVFKEVQYYSHVIHLVSKVTATLNSSRDTLLLAADTFPAGTLSGAPKYRAMELIESYEKTNRQNYGGAIGFIGFNGNFNHAIMIRTFLSRNCELRFQAGAGIVAKSSPESELQEVNNKVAALRQALLSAEKIEL